MNSAISMLCAHPRRHHTQVEIDACRLTPLLGHAKNGGVTGGLQLRKQYHFRPSKQGYYAWDVDRLITLTKHFQRQRVKLGSIREIDENFWFGDKHDKPTCRAIMEHMRLIEEADLSYPVILSSDGRVMDGMHRVVKALLKGQETIEAVQFNQDPKPDYEDMHPNDLPYE